MDTKKAAAHASGAAAAHVSHQLLDGSAVQDVHARPTGGRWVHFLTGSSQLTHHQGLITHSCFHLLNTLLQIKQTHDELITFMLMNVNICVC